MKPSTLSRPRGALSWGLVALSIVVLAVGCAAPAPVADDSPDGSPPKVKQPPNPKGGSETAAGCDGVSEAGECRDGTAVTCDLEAGTIRRKDCRALGKTCVVDSQRGAQCEAVTGGGGDTAPCDGGVTFEGTCGGDGKQTATWCDTQSRTTISWDCDAEGLACQSDTCAVGAYCCGSTPPPPPSSECPTLGFYGECAGDKARWCNGDQIVEQQCSDGKTCQLDACASGAFCCTPPQMPVSECEQIGIRGVCTAAGKARWCSGSTVMEDTCSAGETCQTDTCADGAFCCAL